MTDRPPALAIVRSDTSRTTVRQTTFETFLRSVGMEPYDVARHQRVRTSHCGVGGEAAVCPLVYRPASDPENNRKGFATILIGFDAGFA